MREHRNKCAALDGRLSDANASVQRLREALAHKRERLVNDVLGGGALESFMVRSQLLMWCMSTSDVLTSCTRRNFVCVQERLEGQQRQVEKEAQEVATIAAWRQLFTMGIQNATAQHKCNMCERPFTAAEEAAFVQNCDHKVKVQLPEAERKKEADHRAAADVFKMLTQARPTWEDCQRLKNEELPAAEHTAARCACCVALDSGIAQYVLTSHCVVRIIFRLQSERDAAARELATLEQRQVAQKERAALFRQLDAEASTMMRLWQEAGDLRTRADMAQRSIAHMNAASKSMEQLNSEIKNAETSLSVEEHRCQQLRDRLQAMQTDVINVRWILRLQRATFEALKLCSLRCVAFRCLQLERSAMSCRESLHMTKTQAEKGNQLERERQDLLTQTEVLKREMSDLERQLTATEAERVAAESAREQTRQECAAAANARSTRLRELQRDMDGYSLQSQAIKAYIDAGKDEELQRTMQNVQAARAKLAENDKVRQKLDAKMEAIKNKELKRDAAKRDLDDNVAYMQGLHQVQQLREDIDRNTAAAAQLGSMASMQEEVVRFTKELEGIRNEQHALRGRIETHGEQATKCKSELKAAVYKDIDERFRQENIALRTTEMANDDLNKYHTALDKALMAFHASKMAEINKVIRELWQKTYRNPDIDHIAIVSDAESATSTGRSYNYRVVMRNREEELDMRGRCSAGQKVLACLIIRLALAETFCLNCGILALDEPTTNLDAANSASLAQALTDIMHARREQANFQLIVITHDIKFAHLIGQREHADFYWRISKDEELHSHIEREDILE